MHDIVLLSRFALAIHKSRRDLSLKAGTLFPAVEKLVESLPSGFESAIKQAMGKIPGRSKRFHLLLSSTKETLIEEFNQYQPSFMAPGKRED